MLCKLYVRVPRPPLPVNLQVHRICAYVGALLYLLPVLLRGKPALVIEAFSARHLELLAPSNFSSPYDLPPQQRKNLFFMSAERLDGYIGNYVILSQGPYQSAGLARIIDLDIQCAQLVFGRLMQAELLLRRLTVESYERLSQTPYDYLEPGYYLETSPGSVTRLLEDLDEQYRRTNPHHHEAPMPPFEQVVDSFSLGLLSRFITQYRPDAQDPILFWKTIAHELEIPVPAFQSNLKSLTVFRNRVAHHDRLWASTSPEAARKARLFTKRLRGSHPRSLHVAVLNLALFLGPGEREECAREFENFIAQDELYYIGATTLHTNSH